ncbi:hypothetical protein ACHAWF_014946 [Thalassiosira exigua]
MQRRLLLLLLVLGVQIAAALPLRGAPPSSSSASTALIPPWTQSASPSDFFERQLDVCRRIVAEAEAEDDDGPRPRGRGAEGKGEAVAGIRRSKFREHPRCTARFGEALLRARDGATGEDERLRAVHNARSVVDYVESRRESGAAPIREGLIADLAAALRARPLRRFRVKQIEDAPAPPRREDGTKPDFAAEDADQEILGRLYYSAVRAGAKCLDEVGLTPDHSGITCLLALCRAASSVVSAASENATDPEAELDAALSNHFNGITAPGCRFKFSRRHGIQNPSGMGRAKSLVIAFSSLGMGLVRFEWQGSLAKLNNQLHAEGGDSFDVLFVADPSQSWYQKGSRGGRDFVGFREYEKRIRAASRPYGRVSLVGDSMGGSGALLFSHLATEAVVAFSPQVNLAGDAHVSRYDMTARIREKYVRRLLSSVDEVGFGVRVIVHRGVENADIGHTDFLVNRFSQDAPKGPRHSGELEVIEHPDCEHHNIAAHLKEKGQLAKVLSRNLVQVGDRGESVTGLLTDDNICGESEELSIPT